MGLPVGVPLTHPSLPLRDLGDAGAVSTFPPGRVYPEITDETPDRQQFLWSLKLSPGNLSDTGA